MTDNPFFGVGYCRGCQLYKSLAMVALPKWDEEKDGPEPVPGAIPLGRMVDGEFVPAKHERVGYCEPCAIELITKKKKQKN